VGFLDNGDWGNFGTLKKSHSTEAEASNLPVLNHPNRQKLRYDCCLRLTRVIHNAQVVKGKCFVRLEKIGTGGSISRRAKRIFAENRPPAAFPLPETPHRGSSKTTFALN
jgi:hypothetical protein